MRRPVLDAAGRELDQIELAGLSAVGHHGVLDHERADGQPFRADVVLHLDSRRAAATDSLDATVSYAEVAEETVAILSGEPAALIETVAARIAERALARPAVEAVDVTVHKPRAPISVPFTDVTVTLRRHRTELNPFHRRPAEPVGFVISAGANLGDARATLAHALADLARHPGIEVTGVSPLARTRAVLAPGDEPQPDYLNAVLTGRTSLSPRELLQLCQRLELAHGRVRRGRWEARTLDLDLVVVDGITGQDDALVLPHPRAHERAFVLCPWAAVDPSAVLPGHGTVGDLARHVAGHEDLTWVDRHWFGLAAEPGAAGRHGASS